MQKQNKEHNEQHQYQQKSLCLYATEQSISEEFRCVLREVEIISKEELFSTLY